MDPDNISKIKEFLDDHIKKGGTHLVVNPETLQKLKESGLTIERKLVSYEDYFEQLVAEKRVNANEYLSKLPLVDYSKADGVIVSIYDEIRSSYALGIFTSTIVNAILLLEYSVRLCIYRERLKSDPNSNWADLEKLDLGNLIKQLYKLKIIDSKEKGELIVFNEKLRNPYLHINIHKLSEGIIIESLPSMNIVTGESKELHDIPATEHKELWFASKKLFDKENVQPILEFCIGWANKLINYIEKDKSE